MHEERRTSSRHPFFALAEITEKSTRYLVSARINELSRGGCSVDMLSPFHSETAVDLRIVVDGEVMELPARVVHSEPNMGMGLRFDARGEARMHLLDRWLPGVDV